MIENGWIVATDANYVGGMLHMIRSCASRVSAVVVGASELSELISKMGVDEVICIETDASVPPEAYVDAIVELARNRQPGIIVSNEAPAARVLLGRASGAISATVLGDVIDVEPDGDSLLVRRRVAGGIAIEEVAVQGAVAAVFGGKDVDVAEGESIAVQKHAGGPLPMRIVEERLPAAGAVDLSEATRIIGLGRGVRSREDLGKMQALADQLGAALACTLPLCDDSHWFPAENVIGSSHSQAAPELYIALGVSGSPNHVSGVKNSKVIVAVNNDPEAAIFRKCHFGVVGDLYEFVPAFQKALED